MSDEQKIEVIDEPMTEEQKEILRKTEEEARYVPDEQDTGVEVKSVTLDIQDGKIGHTAEELDPTVEPEPAIDGDQAQAIVNEVHHNPIQMQSVQWADPIRAEALQQAVKLHSSADRRAAGAEATVVTATKFEKYLRTGEAPA